MKPQYQGTTEAATEGVRPDIGALYQEHRDAMYGVARRLLRGDDWHRAEDVVQDVVVSLLSHPPTGVQNWEAFLVHAVKTKIWDLWKSAAYRHEKLLLEAARPLEDERHGGDDLGIDPASVVEEAHGKAATVAEVRAAMAELERREPKAAHAYRQVKVLERTSLAVAAELGVSGSRVRQLVMKARDELLKIISEGRGGAL